MHACISGEIKQDFAGDFHVPKKMSSTLFVRPEGGSEAFVTTML